MFTYDSILDRRNLEAFLSSETKIANHLAEEEKPIKNNFVRQVVNYFTRNSHIAYTYHFNESTDDVEYNIPKYFSGDIRNIKNYLTNLFVKSK